jgi:hypothetical protein
MWEAFEEFQSTLTQNFQNAELLQKNYFKLGEPPVSREPLKIPKGPLPRQSYSDVLTCFCHTSGN